VCVCGGEWEWECGGGECGGSERELCWKGVYNECENLVAMEVEVYGGYSRVG
jgi:hypothetical protein